jgi:cytochrome bd ubiquinol oxidase subunit II
LAEPELLCALALAAGLVMYALFGGADFGGGIWTAFASGPRAEQQRDALFDAIGPVWETNHVWLIFVVVALFTAFPIGFAELFTALLAPLVLALVGITFRGGAFAFRHFGRETGNELPLTAMVFEIASVLTPFTLGMAVAATAAGRLTMVGGEIQGGLAAWANPFTIMGGVVGLAICAYLAPVYMAVRVSGELQDDFRLRGMLAGLILGAVTTLTIPVAYFAAPLFAKRLLGSWPLCFVSLAVACGIGTQLLLWKRRFLWAEIGAACTVAATLGGFAAALHPDLVIGALTLKEAAAPRPTLVAFLAILPVGALVLLPSLGYLYWTFRGAPDPENAPDDLRR